MSIVQKIKRAARGEVNAKTAALEVLRRSGLALERRRERAKLNQLGQNSARLGRAYASMSGTELLEHFRSRPQPRFLPGFSTLEGVAKSQRSTFPAETDQLLAASEEIIEEHAWSIMGLGKKEFGFPVDWHRDPVSGVLWPTDYHREMNLNRGDGSDVRVLWELNRLPHFITLARAYALTRDERFTTEFLSQLESWREQNPCGYGANWTCAMEVALRSINLVAAFDVFRHSPLLTDETLLELVSIFEQHGTFIRRNLEFSYLATSNHYLSDVVGLVWLGVMLPELHAAEGWRSFGLREMLREMDKQVLPDGADFEASTGYHRFVVELFLYTFILCRANAVSIEKTYWDKLKAMVAYTRAYIRPDGRAPLIGDSDGGQVLPIKFRDADDHAYVAGLGAVVFGDPTLLPARSEPAEEVLWILGQPSFDKYRGWQSDQTSLNSTGFAEAGVHIMRSDDLCLIFNSTHAGIGGRGSHGHNDALSVDISAGGVAFIVDPGSYVYTADLAARHRFRSTAYHSTVEIDGLDQNTTEETLPFVIGNEAQPRVLVWETGADSDRIVGEHIGYARLKQAVIHRRTVVFHKKQRWWAVKDEFVGSGNHDLAARFHFNAGLAIDVKAQTMVVAHDKISGGRLFVCAVDCRETPQLVNQFTSKNYYSKAPSVTAAWQFRAQVPFTTQWIVIPVGGHEDAESLMTLRLSQAKTFLENNQK